MSWATNDSIITDINNRISQIIDGVTSINTNRGHVDFFKYGVKIDKITHTIKASSVISETC